MPFIYLLWGSYKQGKIYKKNSETKITGEPGKQELL